MVQTESKFSRFVVVVVVDGREVEVPMLAEMAFDDLHGLMNGWTNDPIEIEREEQGHGQDQGDEQEQRISTIFLH